VPVALSCSFAYGMLMSFIIIIIIIIILMAVLDSLYAEGDEETV